MMDLVNECYKIMGVESGVVFDFNNDDKTLTQEEEAELDRGHAQQFHNDWAKEQVEEVEE